MTQEKTIRIFLLRGLARESRHWGRFVPLLRSCQPNVLVFPLDITGTGRFNGKRSPWNAADYIPFLRSQYLSHAQSGDAHYILGLSFGGMLAAQWLATHDGDFQGGILLNTSGRPAAIFQRMRPSGILQLLKTSLIVDPLRREKLLASFLCNSAAVDDVAAEWTKIHTSAPISVLNKVRQLFCAALFTFPPSLDVPLLLLTSAHDRLVSSSCSEQIKRDTDATLISHPHAGHDLTTDEPEWCVTEILRWLDTLHPR